MTEATSYKLTYFPIPGRGEAIRFAFRVGKIPFEDNRIDFASFGKLKTEGAFPLGSVPVLDVDGKRFCESNAILRFVGKLANLYPHCPFAALRVDEILDMVEDFQTPMGAVMRLPADERGAAREKLLAKGASVYNVGACLVARWTENGSGEFLVGKHLTIADLKIAGVATMIASGFLDGVSKTYFADNWPEFGAYLAKILAICEAAK